MSSSINYKYVNKLLQDEAGTAEVTALLSIQFPIPSEHNITRISRDDIHFFSELLRTFLEVDVWSREIEDCLLAVFKALRNSMAYNPIGQNLIVEQESILHNINCLLSNKISKSNALTQMCLKFLTNLIVQNKNSAFNVWKHFGETIINLLRRNISTEMTVTLYYNILLLQPSNVPIDLEMFHCICSLHKLQESEMTTYCLQTLLLKYDLLFFYDSIENIYKLTVLQIIQDALDMNHKLTVTQVKFVADMFKARWPYLVSFYTNSQNETSDIKALQIIHLVNILGTLTSSEKDLIALQEDRNLFVETFLSLKSVHETGKQYQNIFTPINNLGDTERATSMQGLEELQGFKSTLIRIIGNLCNNHKSNQDEIRELDGIGFILDCCKIDSRNPLIMQWAIYAIRNICKNNQENQNHISSMKMQSGSYSKSLNEMGVTLCNE